MRKRRTRAARKTSRGTTGIRYCAGVVLHDADRLDHVIYRSPTPLFVPETSRELDGRIGNVVFPTAIDPRPDLGPRIFDIYYGIADEAIGRGRLTLGVSRRGRNQEDAFA